MNTIFNDNNKKILEIKDSEFIERAAIGSGQVLFSNVISKVLQFIKITILARLLTPSDFGLMGMALIVISTVETFSQPGFFLAMVQKKENIEKYLDAVWTFLLVRGISLYFIILILTPFISDFFENQELIHILPIAAVAILINNFLNIGTVYFHRELDFKKQVILQLSGSIFDFIIAVTLALIINNVYALVLGLISGSIIRVIVSYITHPYRPKLSFQFRKIRDLFNFGKWITAFNMIKFIMTQIDSTFIGKFISSTTLGYYQIAYKFSNMPATELSVIVNQVTFPLYTRIQKDIRQIRNVYLKVLQFIGIISLPLASLLFILSSEFVDFFLGKKWLLIVPCLKVLTIFGASRAINATFGSLIQGIGKPNILTKLALFQLFLTISIIYPLMIYNGIVGVSMAVTIPSLIVTLYILLKTKNLLGFSSIEYVKIIGFPLIASLTGILVISLLKFYFMSTIIFLFIELLSFVATIVIIIVLFDKFSNNYRLGQNILSFIQLYSSKRKVGAL